MGRVTIKGLLAHKLRFALTALAVMLGVAFMSGTMVLTDTISRTFDNLFADVNKGTDAYVRSAQSLSSGFGGPSRRQRGRIPASLLPEIQSVPGAAAAEGHLQFYAQLVDKKGDAIGNPGQGAPTFGFNWGTVKALNPYRLEPGGHAPQGNQVVIDAASAQDAGFKVGDTITILTQGPPGQYQISGIAKFGDADSAAGSTAALFDTPTAQSIAGAPDQFDSISVVADPGVSQKTLTERIAAKLDSKSYQVLTGEQITKENQNDIKNALQFFNVALLVFALIALFVGTFIIFNTFSIVVAQRLREMALLRAIGASGRQVLASVLTEAVLVGLFASVIGLGAGIVLSNALKAVLDAFGFDIPAGGTVVTAQTVIVALLVGTGVTIFSAVVPARKASRVPPIAAMRDVATEGRPHSGRRVLIGFGITLLGVLALFAGLFGGQGIQFVGLGALIVFIGVFVLGPAVARPLSDWIGWPAARLRGITGTLARDNAMRNPKRTSATAAALMIGVALVGFITIFAASAKESIDAQVDEGFKADYVISTGTGFGASFGGFSPQLATDISKLPQVGASSPLRINHAEFNGSSQFFAGVDPRSANEVFNLKVEEGKVGDLAQPNSVGIARTVADDKHWGIGSRVQTQFPNGTTNLTVKTIYANGNKQGLADYAMSISTMSQHYTNQLDQYVFVNLAEGVSPAEGRKAIDGVLKAYPNAELQDRTEFKDAQAAQINQLLGLIYVMLLLAVIIALIGIANTLALSIYERTRELGLLRAVGMSRRQLRSSIRWESVIIALLGTLVGLVIGFFFGWAVIQALKDQGFTRFAPPAGQLILVVIVGGLAGVLAAVFPARRAAKLDVLQAVTHE
ncbi:MAG TPA: FtsX-like permease family protein [Acidimicrobiia bacterium]|nr:FtsX-like permease family protein [Acidimicrobiia bacterium]